MCTCHILIFINIYQLLFFSHKNRNRCPHLIPLWIPFRLIHNTLYVLSITCLWQKDVWHYYSLKYCNLPPPPDHVFSKLAVTETFCREVRGWQRRRQYTSFVTDLRGAGKRDLWTCGGAREGYHLRLMRPIQRCMTVSIHKMLYNYMYVGTWSAIYHWNQCNEGFHCVW